SRSARRRRLPGSEIDSDAISQGRSLRFAVGPPRAKGRDPARATPLGRGRGKTKTTFGAILVAKPKDQLANRVVPLLERLGLALLGGLVVAAILGLYISRRLVRPVLDLSGAADDVSRGRYEVDVPRVRGADEIGHLADRFREMAARLSEAEQQE